MTALFASDLAVDFNAFLEFKRTLGYPYRRAEFTLRALDRFLVERNPARHLRLDEIILAWLERRPGRKPVSVACELAVVRQFYAFLRRQGRRSLHEPLWPRLPSTSDYVPYVLSTDEVRRLLSIREKITGACLLSVLYLTCDTAPDDPQEVSDPEGVTQRA
jgi:site-specific recombinase XerD